jgi:drug/metabolite transporter, DME family
VVTVIESRGVGGKTAPQTEFDVLGVLAVLLACACWGSSGVFIKFVVADSGISALALAFWRDLSTFLVLLIGLAIARPAWLRVRRRDLVWLFCVGGCLGGLHVFWNLGVLVNGAAVATVQQAAAPAIVAVVARLIWLESLTRVKIVAIVLTFAGTVIVSGPNVLGGLNLSVQGYLIGLGIPILYAAWTLFGKKVRRDYNAVTTLIYAFGFAALVLLPLQPFTPQPFPVKVSSLLWFAGMIAIPTVAGFIAFTSGLGRLAVSVATIVAMSEIVFVSVYAYFLLGERLTPSQILGTLLVVAGVMFLSWNGRRNVEACSASAAPAADSGL